MCKLSLHASLMRPACLSEAAGGRRAALSCVAQRPESHSSPAFFAAASDLVALASREAVNTLSVFIEMRRQKLQAAREIGARRATRLHL